VNSSYGIDYYIDLNKYLFRFYFLDRRKLLSFRDRQFKEIIDYAYKKIPFYKNNISKHKINPDRINRLDQIKELPITRPEDLFLRFEHIENDKKREHITLRSSGTTGFPKDIHLSYFDWFYLRKLAYLRMFFTSGCSIFHKTLFLSSQPHCLNMKPKWFLRFGIMRTRSISINNPGFKNAEFFNKYKPDVFNCLTADGMILANLIRRNARYTHRAKYLFTSGEILTEKDKQVMVATLGDKVIDVYANTEAGIIAWQCCKSGEYHINADQIYIEIMNGEKRCRDGEVGEIVLTSLAPFSLPLIRYRTGDMAAIEHERCKCGSWFPRLLQIKGRKDDFLIDSEGERISPYVLMSTMDKFKNVIKYKICQNTLTEYTIYVRLKEHHGNAITVKENIRRIYHEIFGVKSKILVADLTDFHLLDVGQKRKTIQSYVETE
jgi:phenylacetate-CoA ligase